MTDDEIRETLRLDFEQTPTPRPFAPRASNVPSSADTGKSSLRWSMSAYGTLPTCKARYGCPL